MNVNFVELILKERQWSWSVVGLVFICLALLLRAFLLMDVVRSIRIRNKSLYKKVLVYYQKRSIVGWIFFGLTMLGITLFWRNESFFLKRVPFVEWLFVFVLLFLLSVFFHLKAYARSIVDAVQEQVAMDKEL